MTRFRIAILAAVWIVGGCSAAGGPSERAGASPAGMSAGSSAPSTSVGNASPSSSPGVIDLPASVTDPVVAEMARIAAVGIEQVTIVSATSVTFPDSSLGCPLPGMAYSQIVTDGYRIVAMVAGTRYDYRGTGASFRRCPSGAAQPSPG